MNSQDAVRPRASRDMHACILSPTIVPLKSTVVLCTGLDERASRLDARTVGRNLRSAYLMILASID